MFSDLIVDYDNCALYGMYGAANERATSFNLVQNLLISKKTLAFKTYNESILDYVCIIRLFGN